MTSIDNALKNLREEMDIAMVNGDNQRVLDLLKQQQDLFDQANKIQEQQMLLDQQHLDDLLAQQQVINTMIMGAF